MKVFLSHASEDKKLVEQVHIRLGSRYPEIQGWLDKYEILGGDDFIEKIHAGIAESDKFLIFLSPNSIDKPWVRTELRKALADEINGIKPEFIIPIKVGHISQVPPFLESRLYIDLETKTEEEWLQDLYAAITRTKRQIGEATENLTVSTYPAIDNPHAALVAFESHFWAEPIGFKIVTSAKIKSTKWIFPELKGMHMLSISEIKADFQYALLVQNLRIRPKSPFAIGIEFEEPGNPTQYIDSVQRWDGSGGESSLQGIVFGEESKTPAK
jgi:hypothetical protein